MKFGDNDVLLVHYDLNDGDSLLLVRHEYPDSPYVKFLVGWTEDGFSWSNMGGVNHFHSGDYSGEENALQVAKLIWMYRAGFVADFQNIQRQLLEKKNPSPALRKALDALHISKIELI